LSSHQTEKNYEPADLSVKRVVGAGLILALATIASFGLMFGAYQLFEKREQATDAATMPATRVAMDGPQRPPEPILQGSPGSRFELRDPLPEMIEMHEQEAARLGGYGWVDRPAGKAHIPIVEAKKLVLQRGLASREQR
jgi:hypothetical protein